MGVAPLTVHLRSVEAICVDLAPHSQDIAFLERQFQLGPASGAGLVGAVVTQCHKTLPRRLRPSGWPRRCGTTTAGQAVRLGMWLSDEKERHNKSRIGCDHTWDVSGRGYVSVLLTECSSVHSKCTRRRGMFLPYYCSAFTQRLRTLLMISAVSATWRRRAKEFGWRKFCIWIDLAGTHNLARLRLESDVKRRTGIWPYYPEKKTSKAKAREVCSAAVDPNPVSGHALTVPWGRLRVWFMVTFGSRWVPREGQEGWGGRGYLRRNHYWSTSPKHVHIIET